MNLFSTSSSIITLLTIGGLAAWNIYNSLTKQKSSNLADENNAFQVMKNELEAHKIQIANLEGKVHELSKQISNKDSVISEKDKQITMMKEMFENRNPELLNILTEIRDFMKKLLNTNEHQTDILETQVKAEVEIAERDKNLVVGRTGVLGK